MAAKRSGASDVVQAPPPAPSPGSPTPSPPASNQPLRSGRSVQLPTSLHGDSDESTAFCSAPKESVGLDLAFEDAFLVRSWQLVKFSTLDGASKQHASRLQDALLSPRNSPLKKAIDLR